jgi:hypothetical protein
MAEATPQDHDQRLKVLLKEFFEQFIRCFFPAWAERFDFNDVSWLDKELFLAPPQGEKRQLDLVARLRIKPEAPPAQAELTELLALIHVEVEARDSVQQLRPRMFEYYVQLRHDCQLPVLPIGLFLRAASTASVGMRMRSIFGNTAWCVSSMHMWDCRRWRRRNMPAVSLWWVWP